MLGTRSCFAPQNEKQMQRRKRRERPSSSTPRKGSQEESFVVQPFDNDSSGDEEGMVLDLEQQQQQAHPNTMHQAPKRLARGDVATPRTCLNQVISAWEETDVGSPGGPAATANISTLARPQTPSAPRLVVVQAAEGNVEAPSALKNAAQVHVSAAVPHSHSSVRESPRLSASATTGDAAMSPKASATGDPLLLPAPTPFRTAVVGHLEAADGGGSSLSDGEGSSSSGGSQHEGDGPMVDAGGFLELGSAGQEVDMDILRTACAYGNVERTAALIRQGQDVNGTDSEGRTALMYAVYCERYECAALLINQGAHLDQQADDGSTATHRAAFCGSARMLQLLLDSGANHLVCDEEGRIPLHWAAHNKHIGCLSALVKRVKPSGINLQDASGMTPAMWAAYYNMPEHLAKLLRHGANPAAVDSDGKMVLHWTVNCGGCSCLRQLLTFENSHARDSMSRSVLHTAAEAGAVKACKYILAMRPSAVRDIDINDRTPLHWAAACGKARVLRALMKRGADPEAVDNTGRTAKDYAVDREFLHCVAVLNNEQLYGLPVTDMAREREVNIETAGGPSAAVLEVVSMLTRGSYLGKYTGKGRGPAHQRYFWVDGSSGELCWVRAPADFAKNPGSTQAQPVLAACSGASGAVRGRRDYEPAGRHRYAFTVTAGDRTLDLIAPDEEHLRLWVDGLRCLTAFGADVLVDVLASAYGGGE